MSEIHTLYAITHSLYSGRARSYLIKNGIPFRELSTGHESFKADILPKGKLPTIPTLLTPQGEVIRDGAAIIEYFEAGGDFLADDKVPDSLLAVLKILAEDFVPETRAAADTINAWLADNPPEPGASAERMLGTGQFAVRGQAISAVAQPYRFYLLQRVQSAYESVDASDKASVDEMLAACGMSELLTVRLDRQLGRVDNLEVWL